MPMTKERRQAIRTLRGWAISVLQEAGAIRECEEHGWAQDRADRTLANTPSTSQGRIHRAASPLAKPSRKFAKSSIRSATPAQNVRQSRGFMSEILFPRAAQRVLKLLLLAFPPGVLDLDPLLDRGPFGIQGRGAFFVLTLRRVQCCLRFRDQLVALRLLLFPRRFFLAALGILPSLLALEIGCGLFRVLLADFCGLLPFRLRSALLLAPAGLVSRSGRSACSAKRPVDPPGRLRTMPGFDIVAATTSGSSVSLAAP